MDIFDPSNYGPDYQAPEMEPGAKKFIDESIASGDRPMKSAYEESQRAAQSAGGLLPTIENMGRQESAMGRDNKAQIDAILKKGESLFSSDLRKLMIKNQMESFQARQNQLGEKYNLSHRQWQFFDQIRQERLRAEQNRIATRNGVIGQILGTVGFVAGFAAGGPVGAMAGAQAGRVLSPKTSTQDAYDQTESRMWQRKDYDMGEM